jgi:putative PIN family toxin of toxin-antitoxin system
MTPRAVFDCMVLLHGAGRPAAPAAACLRLVDEGRVVLCVSAEILAEVRDVLTRPVTLRKFPGLSPEWVASFVRQVELKGVLFTGVPHAVTLQRDPKDEPYLNLAVAAGAKYLVSRDLDLLNLMKDETFRGHYPTLLILEPIAFLQDIARSRQSEEDAGREEQPVA